MSRTVRRLKPICLLPQTCNSMEITSYLVIEEEPKEGNPKKHFSDIMEYSEINTSREYI